jgi:hypothetical protein
LLTPPPSTVDEEPQEEAKSHPLTPPPSTVNEESEEEDILIRLLGLMKISDIIRELQSPPLKNKRSNLNNTNTAINRCIGLS